MWLRLMALMCALWLGGASTAQACHSHDDESTLSKNSPVNVPADHCPLCLAMHTARPAADQSTPLLVQDVQELSGEQSESGRLHVWCLALFSRPPPARRDISVSPLDDRPGHLAVSV